MVTTAPDTSTPPSLVALPINADEGFPQAFRFALGENVYAISLYVNVPEEDVLATSDDGFFDLPTARGFMVMHVAREGVNGTTVIFQRKLVLNLAYVAAELGLFFSRIHVAKNNLNGVGSFGSDVEGWVALL